MSGWKVEVEGGRLNKKKIKKHINVFLFGGFYISLLGGRSKNQF